MYRWKNFVNALKNHAFGDRQAFFEQLNFYGVLYFVICI